MIVGRPRNRGSPARLNFPWGWPCSRVLVDADPLWRRWNARRHRVQLAGSQFDVGGRVEPRGYKRAASGHSHAAGVVRLAVKDVSAAGMDNAHQGILGRILRSIAVSSCPRPPVELRPGNRIIRLARAGGLWKRNNRWPP
jgi:hypothetical protein